MTWNPLLNGGEFMSTFETTVDLMKNLPENDLLKIKAFINHMIDSRNEKKETYNPFVSLSREEIFAQLEYSRKRAEEGHVILAHQASSLVREKYGL